MSRLGSSRHGRPARHALVCVLAALALCAAAPGTPVPAVPPDTPAARVRPAPPEHYVALGDSEASAPGVPHQVDARCQRSDHDYPALVAARLRPAAFIDRSCAGARAAELARGQFAALRRDTTLVTLSIGANDVGFAGVMVRCSALGLMHASGAPCRAYYGDRIDHRITATAAKVADALRTVHRLAPHARVLLVGYLNLIPDDHRGCRPRELFAAGDLAWLDDTENALDTMLALVARQERFAGFTDFVDNHRVSAAHDVCRPAGTRWTEAIRPARATASFHPNARGEAAMAGQVLSVLHGR